MILVIDTFSDVLGIGIFSEDKSLKALVEYKNIKPFSEVIIQELDRLVKQLEISKESFTKIVVNKGPGGYTGLRVGITTAKTLSYAWNIPIFGYTSLEAMYYPYRFCGKKVVSAVYAGKNEVYLQVFDGEKKSDILLVKMDTLNEYVSDETVLITKNLNVEKSISISGSLVKEGFLLSIENKFEENRLTLEPVYVRSS